MIWIISLEVFNELNFNNNFLNYLYNDDKLQVIHNSEDVLEHSLGVHLSVRIGRKQSLNQKETWDINARVVDHSLEEDESKRSHEVNRVISVEVITIDVVH